MRVVETLLLRDEEDILEAHLNFHLNAGVDFVVAIDHESRDGTTGILEEFARAGYLRRIEKRGPMREEEWRTVLARLAAVEHGADWVINADADQFWWPRGESLRAVLNAVRPGFRAIRAFDRVFVPRPDDGAHFAERMTYRFAAPAAINAPASTYRPLARVLHRADPNVVVTRGSHSISGGSFDIVPNWHPVEVLHFPWRSAVQMTRKAGHLVRAFEGRPRQPTAYHAKAFRAVADERAEAHYSALAVDDSALERGLAGGLIASDTRLRDTLRSVAGTTALRPPGLLMPRPAGSVLVLTAGPPGDDAAYAADAAILRDADTLRAQRRLDALALRVDALERASPRARRLARSSEVEP